MTLIPELERNLIDAAARARSPRRVVVWAAVPAAVVAVAVGALAVVLAGGSDGDGRPSTGDSVRGDATGTGAGGVTGTGDATGAGHATGTGDLRPPPSSIRPLAGTFSRPVSFRFDGVGYRMAGFRARGELICIRLEPRPPARPPRAAYGVTCAGERLLRRRFAATQVVNVGGGGGRLYRVAGFATRATTDVALTGTRRPNRVVLSAPWRPPGWSGGPIRMFVALVVWPPGERGDPRRAYMRVRVVPVS